MYIYVYIRVGFVSTLVAVSTIQIVSVKIVCAVSTMRSVPCEPCRAKCRVYRVVSTEPLGFSRAKPAVLTSMAVSAVSC